MRLSPGDVLAIVAQKNGTERSVAAGVVGLEVSHPGGTGSVQQPLSVKLTLERNIPGQIEPEQFQLTRDVFFRNGF